MDKMHFVSRVARRVSLLTVLFFSANALADVTAPQGINSDLGELGPGSWFVHMNSADGMFEDTYAFGLSEPVNFEARGASVDLALLNQDIFNIEGFDIGLYSADGSRINGVCSYDDCPIFLTNMPAGDYHLAISGDANGLSGGLYTFAMAVAPTPEPGIWVLLTAGLLLIGYRLRKYHNKENLAGLRLT